MLRMSRRIHGLRFNCRGDALRDARARARSSAHPTLSPQVTVRCSAGRFVWQRRPLVTSAQRRALPIKAVVGRVLWTRFLHAAWTRITTSKQRARFRKALAPTVVAGSLLTGGYLYWSNLDAVPATGRNRFMWISREQEIAMAKPMADSMREDNLQSILPPKDPRVRYVTAVLWRIVHRIDPSQAAADRYMLDHPWSLHVIDGDVQNAFCLPGGYVFVYTGILKTFKNDDELANVLSHEIGHVLARHGAEAMSWLAFFGLLQMALLGLLVLVLPADLSVYWSVNDYLFAAGQQLAAEYLVHLPHSRLREAEADVIGQRLLARACYDPYRASDWWGRLAKDSPNVAWNSTHPSHESRRDELTKLAPEAKCFGDKLGDCQDFLASLEAAGKRVARKPLTKQQLELLGAVSGVSSKSVARRVHVFDKSRWKPPVAKDGAANVAIGKSQAAASNDSASAAGLHVGEMWDPTLLDESVGDCGGVPEVSRSSGTDGSSSGGPEQSCCTCSCSKPESSPKEQAK